MRHITPDLNQITLHLGYITGSLKGGGPDRLDVRASLSGSRASRASNLPRGGWPGQAGGRTVCPGCLGLKGREEYSEGQRPGNCRRTFHSGALKGRDSNSRPRAVSALQASREWGWRAVPGLRPSLYSSRPFGADMLTADPKGRMARNPTVSHETLGGLCGIDATLLGLNPLRTLPRVETPERFNPGLADEIPLGLLGESRSVACGNGAVE